MAMHELLPEGAVVRIKTKGRGCLNLELFSMGSRERGGSMPFPFRGNSYCGFSIDETDMYIVHHGTYGWWVIGESLLEDWKGEQELSDPVLLLPRGLPKIPRECECGLPSLRQCSYRSLKRNIVCKWTCWGCGNIQRRYLKCRKEPWPWILKTS